MTTSIALIRARFLALKPVMDERLTRLWAGAEAAAIGDRGIAAVAKATGISRTTIRTGRDELRNGASAANLVKVRRAGAGRPSVVSRAPGIVKALDSLIEPAGADGAAAPLRWTAKSTRRLSGELGQKGFLASPQKVSELLRVSGYRLQTPERTSYSDRNKQFALVNERVGTFLARGAPVISVHATIRQLVAGHGHGQLHHALEQASARSVDIALDRELGDVVGHGRGGMSHSARRWDAARDSPSLAVRAIAEWWRNMRKHAYPVAAELLVIIEGGDARGIRAKPWETALQGVARECGLAITVSSLPAGTSRWSSVEHRMVCRVIESWRDRTIVHHETVVTLIGGYETGGQVREGNDASDSPAQVVGRELERRRHRNAASPPARRDRVLKPTHAIELESEIRQVMEDFLAELTSLARHTVLDTLRSAFATAGATAAAPRAVSLPYRARRPGLSPRRNPEDLEALASRLAAVIQENRGLRVGDINQRLGTTTEQLALPLRKLMAAGVIQVRGSRRAATYFPATGEREVGYLRTLPAVAERAGEQEGKPSARRTVDGANPPASPGVLDAALLRCLADVFRLAQKLEK